MNTWNELRTKLRIEAKLIRRPLIAPRKPSETPEYENAWRDASFQWRIDLFDTPVNADPYAPKVKPIYSLDYWTGSGLVMRPRTFLEREEPEKHSRPKTPTLGDVLSCLQSDARAEGENFSDWCADYGYSDDSIKALAIYQECCKIGHALRKAFGRLAFNEFMQADSEEIENLGKEAA